MRLNARRQRTGDLLDGEVLLTADIAFPRTLFVLDNLYVSGAEKVAINLLRHGQSRGLPVDGIVYMDDHLGASDCGARLRAFGGAIGGGFTRRLLRGVSRIPALARVAGDFEILVPVTPPAIPWAMAAGAVSRARVVPWIHYDLDGLALDRFNSGQTARDFLMDTLHTRLAPSFDRLLFVSLAAMASFANARGGAQPGWVSVPNIYDRETLTEATSSCAAALDLCRSKGRVALLFAGRICRQKRWEEAIRVAEILFSGAFAFELHVAGDGPEMELLRQAVDRSPARERIFLHGFDLNLMKALSKADALILTSLHEAWPTVILEAFDLGIPVLSYDCPSGPAEMLGRNLERGVLCDGAEDMAGRIRWLLDSQQRPTLNRMVEDGRRFLDAHLPDHALARWSEALRGIMN